MRREDLEAALRAAKLETPDPETCRELAAWWHRLGCPGRDPRNAPRPGDRVTWSQRGIKSPEVEVTRVELDLGHPWQEEVEPPAGIVTYRRVNSAGKAWGRFLSRPLRVVGSITKTGYTWNGWTRREEVVAHAGWL